VLKQKGVQQGLGVLVIYVVAPK